ncbi:hypothetical protein O3P69_013260 [Scylla paramamosain]|uniref:Uncharacterized protein n=1 Tax=Scylla paramamosain TaxID=85552 RepID=A0AAW0U2E7_SCYPA
MSVPCPARYTKYLYPYECEKTKLSTPAELQAAIDNNRREGRRSSYGSYVDAVQPPLLSLQSLQGLHSPLALANSHFNGGGTISPLPQPDGPPSICMCTATLGNIAITRCSVITYVNDEPTAAAAAGGRGGRASVQMIDIPRPIGEIQAGVWHGAAPCCPEAPPASSRPPPAIRPRHDCTSATRAPNLNYSTNKRKIYHHNPRLRIVTHQAHEEKQEIASATLHGTPTIAFLAPSLPPFPSLPPVEVFVVVVVVRCGKRLIRVWWYTAVVQQVMVCDGGAGGVVVSLVSGMYVRTRALVSVVVVVLGVAVVLVIAVVVVVLVAAVVGASGAPALRGLYVFYALAAEPGAAGWRPWRGPARQGPASSDKARWISRQLPRRADTPSQGAYPRHSLAPPAWLTEPRFSGENCSQGMPAISP